MKRTVQTVLILAILAPLLCAAREETMEERKRRIMRKYLRERSEIYQDPEMFIVDDAENEAITDAERFKQPEQSISEASRPARRQPVQRRRVPVQQERNWLLAEEDAGQDPYGPRRESKPPALETLEVPSLLDDRSQYGIPERERSWFKPRDDASSSREDRSRFDIFGKEQVDSRDPRSQSQQNRWAPGTLQESRDTSRRTGTSWPQTKAPERPAQLSSPFPGLTSPSRNTPPASGERSRGYTPYKSPYQTRSDPRAQPIGPVRRPQTGDKKVDPYQAWKDRNSNRNDPTRDDAYVDELMPKFGQ